MGRKTKPAIRRAAGGVVYRFDERDTLQILMICDRQGRWTLPKGHLDDGETDADAAVREVFEETGVSGAIEQPITAITYPIRRKGIAYTKRVAFFLMRALSEQLVPQEEEVREVAWLAAAAAQQRASYPLVRAVLDQALELLDARTNGGAPRLTPAKEG